MAEISSDATADRAAFEKARRTVRLSKAIMLAVLVVNSMAGAALILSSTFFRPVSISACCPASQHS